MSEELGKISKPQAEGVQLKKKLYLVQNIQNYFPGNKDFESLLKEYWDSISDQLDNLEKTAGNINFIYIEGMYQEYDVASKLLNDNNKWCLSTIESRVKSGSIYKKIEDENFPIITSDYIERISYLESLPLWLVNDLYKWVGNSKGENIVKAFNKKPSIDLRINPLKTDLDKLLKVLHENKIDAEIIKDLHNGITLKSNPRSIKNLPGYSDGLWTIQDRSSQWIAPLLNPKEGEKILDACAAPGSKSTHLAELANDSAEILAVDRSAKRLKILQSNLDRLNLKSVNTLKADATSLIELNPEFISYFDKILLDAPCSGIGTLSRNPDSRWSLSKEKIKSLTLLQEKLLESIFPLLKKDGTLVYSTCTICPDENNLLIERFIEKNKTLKLVSQKQILPSLDYPGDGFYSAIISYKS